MGKWKDKEDIQIHLRMEIACYFCSQLPVQLISNKEQLLIVFMKYRFMLMIAIILGANTIIFYTDLRTIIHYCQHELHLSYLNN